MNIYEAPILIISPRCKVYRKKLGGGEEQSDQSTINSHTHAHTLLLGREGNWDGKKCITRADLKADVELYWLSSGESSIGPRPDRKICVVQRISHGMRGCEGDGSQRKSKAVEKEVELQEVGFAIGWREAGWNSAAYWQPGLWTGDFGAVAGIGNPHSKKDC